MTQIALLGQDGIAQLSTLAPQSYEANTKSSEACIKAGESLLKKIAEKGMSADSDQEAALYLKKTAATLKLMNERRAPVTQIFDRIRSAYTTLENSISANKEGTVPYQISQLRNTYAAQRREEEKRKQQEALRKARREQEKAHVRNKATEQLQAEQSFLISAAKKRLRATFESLTLDNEAATIKTLESEPRTLDAPFGQALFPPATQLLSTQEAVEVTSQIVENMQQELIEGYRKAIDEEVAALLALLPSKRRTLQQIAAADAERAEQLKAQLSAAEAQQAAQREAQAQQAAEAARAEAKRKQEEEEAKALFAQSATLCTTAPQAKVTQRIELLSPEGIVPILSMWLEQEAKKLTLEDLKKTFKKQITFCEKLANKEGILIQSPAIAYVEEVKAQ